MVQSAEPRSRGIMLVTRLDQVPELILGNNLNDKKKLHGMFELALKISGIKRCAAIIHDMDINDGQLVPPHLHIMMEFSRRIRLSTVANKLSVPVTQLESMTHQGSAHGIINGFCYLIHATKDAQETGKYQYSTENILANFNYEQLIMQVQSQLNSSNKPEDVLNDLVNGVIDRAECIQELTNLGGSALANNIVKVDKIIAALDDLKKKKYIEYKKQHPNQPKTVIWIYGRAGTGKTRLAWSIAHKRYGDSVSISGSDNDIYQDVDSSSQCLILDDLRPNKKVTYSDLLRLLDPYSIAPNAPSRYHDKAILADMIIITTPLDPYEFYQKLARLYEMTVYQDSFQQLARRLTKVLHVSTNEIETMERLTMNGQLTNTYSSTDETIENQFSIQEEARITPLTLDELLN